MTRFAAILMLVGAVLAGGGARFAHVMVAHTGAPAADTMSSACGTRVSCHAHGHAHRAAPGKPARPHANHTEDCATCDEIASLTPTPSAPCALVATLELLAVLDAREASQVADPAPIAAVSARPPPDCA